MKKTLWFCNLLILAFALGQSAVVPAQAKAFRRMQLQTTYTVPHTEMVNGLSFGGISALAHLKDDIYLALSDDRGYIHNPRVFKIKASLVNGIAQVTPTDVIILKDKSKQPFKKQILDPEGLVLLPWGNFLISTEPDLKATPTIQTRIIEFKMNGDFVRDISLPAFVKSTDNSGPQNNLGFEGLSLSPDGTQLVAAFESALKQDGEVASFEMGSKNRFLVFNVDKASKTIKYASQFFYETEPVFKPNKNAESKGNGVSEILHVDNNRLFVVERATVFQDDLGYGNHVRIYEFNKTLRSKNLVFDSNSVVSSLPHGRIDNIEAITFGPAIEGDLTQFLMAADNNFNPLQKNLFLFLSAYRSGLPAVQMKK